MLLYLVLVGGPVLAILYQVWRAWDFAHWWRPTQAQVVGSDYSEAERLGDLEPFAWLKPHPFKDGRTGRRTKVGIAYQDTDGHHHQAQVLEFVRRGTSVKAVLPIYVDTRNPNRVDRYGTTGAVAMMLFWGFILSSILYRMATAIPPA